MYVVRPFPQGRHEYGHGVQPIIEVFPELAPGNRMHEIDIRCRHHPHIGLEHLRRAHADELP